MSSVLQVENINVYYCSIHAVKDVSFHVEQGEVVTLIGANGAGKSTTLNTVAGLLHSRAGSVRFLGEELRHVPGHKLVEQNAQAALAVADRGYVLETGRIVTEGTGTALLESDAIRKAYLGDTGS